MKKIFFAAAALLTAGVATAQVAPQIQDRLGEPGWNGLGRDQVQTRAEVAKRVQTMFVRVDTDRDGFITQAETAALRGQARGQRMARRGEGGGRERMFERLDANRDNMISRDEWARAEAARGERRGRKMAMRGGMRGGAMLRAADADRDQRVSLQEATNAALQRFDGADANRDGIVTREERQQRRQQHAPAARR